MSRTTIDFGIDLGTTNSAIAVLNGVTPEIIKNNAKDADITPSAIHINKKGIIRVGDAAKQKANDIDGDGDVYLEFKRRMGTDYVYKFKSSGLERKPEDLSAEILKSLKADVQQRTGEIMESCVITVPAAFELHQCDATRRAAQLAGFQQSPLLQEPVAAALAYGFQTDNQKAYWMIYDFGGGTFDAAVIKAEEGGIHVVNHGGDNFLGGSDIDWAIVEKLLVPRLLKEYPLENFSREQSGLNGQWRRAFSLLKRAAEYAKIELSVNKTALIECQFADSDGEPIQFDCELSQGDVIAITEPIIQRSIDIAKKVLIEKKLPREAIERIILVGGPTKAPYFREQLKAQLGIPLDFSVDPLTVVARGAAVFAGTQKITSTAKAAPIQGEFTIDLKHKPVGHDSSPIVGGTVSGASTQDFTGFTIELVNSKTQWRSGKIPLNASGVFMTNLHAEKGERHTYMIELSDPTGRRLKVTPDSLNYTIGAVVEEQPLINSMGVALANNDYDKLFSKGSGLPLKATRDYRTTHAIRQGQNGELIKIPIVEGENDLADRNRLIDILHVEATNLRRDLPAGSEIEVTLRMDESRLITVTAYVPILDEEFTKKVELTKKTIQAEFLISDFEAEMKRSVKGDVDNAAKFEKRLLELKLQLDLAVNALEWPALVAEAKAEVRDLTRVVEKLGTQQQLQRSQEITQEIDETIKEHNAEKLRKRIERTLRLYWEIVMAQPSWWIYQFQEMEKVENKMLDHSRAAQLLDQGRDCISRNNATGLQNVVRQLWDLLPSEVAEEVKRGYQSGITR
jgi:molecular chaperone DnaK